MFPNTNHGAYVLENLSLINPNHKSGEIMKKLNVLIFLVVGLAVSACQTAGQALEKAGAQKLSKEEITTLFSGNTWKWKQGGGYYDPDGTIHTLWDGERQTGTWAANDNGELCRDVEAWGGNKCTVSFYKQGDVIKAIYKNRSSVLDTEKKIFKGNILDSL